MPVFFWNDPSGAKYRSAYFEAFEDEEVWAHGDFMKVKQQLLPSACQLLPLVHEQIFSPDPVIIVYVSSSTLPAQ